MVENLTYLSFITFSAIFKHTEDARIGYKAF